VFTNAVKTSGGQNIWGQTLFAVFEAILHSFHRTALSNSGLRAAQGIIPFFRIPTGLNTQYWMPRFNELLMRELGIEIQL
jgi:hypothetical protein